MSKDKFIYICSRCSKETAKWVGLCPQCREWNTFEEKNTKLNSCHKTNKSYEVKAVHLSEINYGQSSHVKTGLEKFDCIIGGGFTKDSLTLLSGEPGVGKSTFLIEIAKGILASNESKSVLYISGEESCEQIGNRARRLGLDSKDFYLMFEEKWEVIKDEIRNKKPDFLIIDSIHTLLSAEIRNTAGSVNQIKEITGELVKIIKKINITTMIIGHVTKDGHIAGPKVLEHLVDTVLSLEANNGGNEREIIVKKNRYGSTEEKVFMKMTELGLIEEQYDRNNEDEDTAIEAQGAIAIGIFEGDKVKVTQAQALVVDRKSINAKVTVQGIDSGRVALLCAIIDKHLSMNISMCDIYINIIGNNKLKNRENDLSIIAAILSSKFNRIIGGETALLGEVGLSGEIRRCHEIQNKVRQLSSKKFKHIIMNYQSSKEVTNKYNMNIVGLEKVSDLKKMLLAK